MKLNKVCKIGGTYYVAIPKEYFRTQKINLGDYVAVENHSNLIAVKRVNLSSKKGG